jgi:lipoprotein signal peptidase
VGLALLRPSRLGLDRATAAGGIALLLALTADLVSKTYAVNHGGLGLVYYNHTHVADILRRVLMSLAAVAFTAVAAFVARRRGLGRLWGGWVGAGLLVGGVMGNGLSQLLWARGVPDFIHVYSVSSDVWNVADFEIMFGLAGGMVSIAGSALLAYARGRVRGAPASS